MTTDAREPPLSPLEENILATISLNGGLIPEEIAQRVGVLCSVFFRTVLKNMADRQLCQASGAGYVLAPGASAGRRGPATGDPEAAGQSRPDRRG